MSCIWSGGTCRGGLHHERQPAAPEEEQEEVEAPVVPPQRQGALHLHSLWGEGAQSLPHQPQNSHDHSITEAFLHSLCLSFVFFTSGQPSAELLNTVPTVQPFLLGTTLCVTNEGILCALSVSFDKYASECCKAFSKHEILVIRTLLLKATSVFVTGTCVFDACVLQDKVASESLPLQGFTVKLTERPEGEESSSVFHLYHKKTLYYTFRADDQHTARRSELEIFMSTWAEMWL